MYYFKQFLRIFEKIPGVCLLQVADFGEYKILLLPKVGTRSIRDALILKHYPNSEVIKSSRAWKHINYYTRSGLGREINGTNTNLIVFLREPAKRIESCWRQKIFNPEGLFPYFIFYFPYLYPRMPYSKFVTRILKIPAPFMEKHFLPISYVIEKLELERLDFKGIEELDDTLSKIIMRNDLRRANTTGYLPKENTCNPVKINGTQTYLEDYLLWKKTQL